MGGRWDYWVRVVRGGASFSGRVLTLYGFLSVIAVVPVLGSVFGNLPVWVPIAVLGAVLVVIVGETAFRANRRVEERLTEIEAATDARFQALRYALVLSNLESALWVSPDGDLTMVTLGMIFTNVAGDVIEFKMEKMSAYLDEGGPSVHLEDMAPPQLGGRLVKGQTKTFRLQPITDVASIPDLRGGRIEYQVVYGHVSGGQWFRRRHHFNFTWHTSLGGQRIDNTTYQDLMDEVEPV